MSRLLFSLGVLAPVWAAVLGCARVSCSDPAQVLREYAAAVRAQDAERAWALLSEETKLVTTFEAFRAELRSDPRLAAELADAMERPVGPPVVTTAIGGPDSEPVQLVLSDGKWRLRLSSLDPYPQSTPIAALRSFVRATKHRRYDVLLRLAPARDRKQLDENKLRQAFEGSDQRDVAELSQAIEAGLGFGRLELLGDRATFDLGGGSSVELLLEDGAWRIDNYRP